MKFDKPIYEMDWRKLVRQLIPALLRKPNMLRWLYCLTGGVNELHSRFSTLKNSIAYRLQLTPQVCSIERTLNDKYDVTDRRIWIMDGVEYSPYPLWIKIEDKLVPLSTKSERKQITLYLKSETAQFTTDFVVVVPRAVDFDEKEMIAFINFIKLTGKIFKIQRT